MALVASLCFTRDFPFYITGALTAAGGAWNMSIIAGRELGAYSFACPGLGAYIDAILITIYRV